MTGLATLKRSVATPIFAPKVLDCSQLKNRRVLSLSAGGISITGVGHHMLGSITGKCAVLVPGIDRTRGA